MKASIKKNQKGSALTLLISLFFIFMMVALVVDAGRLYFEQRQLQTAANTIASELADEGQTCISADRDPVKDLQSKAEAKIDSSFSGRNIAVPFAKTVFIDGEDGKLSAKSKDIGADESNGVAVTLTKPVTGLLAFALDSDLSAHAVAKKEITAVIASDSSTASVGNGLVLGLLQQILPGLGGIDATDLNSLKGATASVGELLEAIGVNDVADLLPLTGSDLAEGVGNIAGVSQPAVDILDEALKSSGIDTIELTDILAIAEGSSVPKDTEFPIYDTVISLVLNLAEGSVFNLPATSVSIPNLVDLDLKLTINQAPSVLIGPARWNKEKGDWQATSQGADIKVDIELTVNLGESEGEDLASLEIKSTIKTGASDIALVAAECASGDASEINFITEAAVSGVSLEDSNINTKIAGGLLRVTATLAANVNEADGGKIEFPARLLPTGEPRTPAYGYYDPKSFNASIGGISLKLKDLKVKVLGLCLPLVCDLTEAVVKPVINGILSPLLSSLSSDVLDPLLSGLGVNLGSVSAQLIDANQGRAVLIEGVEVTE